ncbi:hypothetical protein AVEN_216971-1 [Araneus ventricosus]|uniref:Uncharacterized protein n=1 Tax=Araneus ventricosus TaxID=182803 RepID=A0A4Y2SAE2_ARAVE|nr:hypothetical protein AVEN_216971-1 [Araneus ventricosus]
MPLQHPYRLDGHGTKDANSTRCSRVVTLPITDRARYCLTAVIRREPVLSAWYGRWLGVIDSFFTNLVGYLKEKTISFEKHVKVAFLRLQLQTQRLCMHNVYTSGAESNPVPDTITVTELVEWAQDGCNRQNVALCPRA